MSQQPTASSKAKQVTLPHRKYKDSQAPLSHQQAYAMHIDRSNPADLAASMTSQIQLPFPVQTYTKQQLEKMGIPPSTFHSLPLMTQSEIQQHLLRQQLQKEA